jgi:hypothetical protein
VGLRVFPLIALLVGLLFTLYVINYRVLRITLTDSELRLRFGLVSWKIDLENIKEVNLDESPNLIKYGGAGVHFAFVAGEYRAFFNFLEYPRVVIRMRKKRGPVQALVFTTRHPQEILKLLFERIDQNEN